MTKAALAHLSAFRDIAQIARFSIVGTLNVLVSFLVFYATYRVWPVAPILFQSLSDILPAVHNALSKSAISAPEATLANVLGYIAGMLNSFVLNKLWTFKVKGSLPRQIHRFILVNLFGLATSSLFLFLFVDVLGSPYLPIWIIATATVMVFNFLALRAWAFSRDLPSPLCR